MPFVHMVPLRILESWRDVHIQTVENHLRKCDKPFTQCHACASIVVLISEGRFCVLPSNDWTKGLSL